MFLLDHFHVISWWWLKTKQNEQTSKGTALDRFSCASNWKRIWAPATWPWLKMWIQHGQNFFELVEEPKTVLFVLREIMTVLNKCRMSPCLTPSLKYSLSESCKWASVLMPCFDSLSWSNVKMILLKTWHFPRSYSTWYWAFNYHKIIFM